MGMGMRARIIASATAGALFLMVGGAAANAQDAGGTSGTSQPANPPATTPPATTPPAPTPPAATAPTPPAGAPAPSGQTPASPEQTTAPAEPTTKLPDVQVIQQQPKP